MPDFPTATVNGSCHCGAIQFTATDIPQAHILCHCTGCQKQSGGAFTMNRVIPRDSFKLTKGEGLDKVYTYKSDSGNVVEHHFCPTCTSGIWRDGEKLREGGVVIVRTPLFEGAEKWPVEVEIYGDEKLEWLAQVAHTVPKMP